MTYKQCFIKCCNNSTVTTPTKIFVTVPKSVQQRIKWFRSVNQTYSGYKQYCCEDHFDLEKDFKNWMSSKILGNTLELNADVYPHKKLQLQATASQLSSVGRKGNGEVLTSVTGHLLGDHQCRISEFGTTFKSPSLSNDFSSSASETMANQVTRTLLPKPNSLIKNEVDSVQKTMTKDLKNLSHDNVKLVDINKIMNNTLTLASEVKSSAGVGAVPGKVMLIESNTTRTISSIKNDKPLMKYILNNFQSTILEGKDICLIPVKKDGQVDANSLNLTNTLRSVDTGKCIRIKPKILGKRKNNRNFNIQYRCLLPRKCIRYKIDSDGYSYSDIIGFKKREQGHAKRCQGILERYKNVWETSVAKLVANERKNQRNRMKIVNKIKDCSVVMSKFAILKYLRKQTPKWKYCINSCLKTVPLKELLQLKYEDYVFIKEDDLKDVLQLPPNQRAFFVTQHKLLINLYYQTFPQFRAALHCGTVRIIRNSVFHAYKALYTIGIKATETHGTECLEPCKNNLKSSFSVVEICYSAANHIAREHDYCGFIKQESNM